METEGDESGSNRVAYFVPDDEETASAYLAKRRSGKNADQQLLEEGEGEDTSTTQDDEAEGYGFRFMRDYDAIRRDTNKEYIFVIEEEGETEESGAAKNEEDSTGAAGGASPRSRRPKGAYYVPLVAHTLLRKRRARKGEVTNDYDDLGVEFWNGIQVSLGGKEVFPDEEAVARKEELFSIRMPASGDHEEAAQAQVTEANRQ